MTDTDESKLFVKLAGFDTPSICNALEIIEGRPRDTGFTRQTMVVVNRDCAPFMGRAKTATLRSVPRPAAQGKSALAIEYYRYVASPGAVVVIEDLDQPAALGCFWGEVNSTVHHGLQVAGVVTNGGVRDLDVFHPRLPVVAGAVTPSHAFVAIEHLDVTVTVFGMTVSPSDIIHADRHGAVVVPDGMLAELPGALDKLVAKESVIINAAKEDGFDIDRLEQVLGSGDDHH